MTSRGFFANRCVGRYIAEGNEMFLEGVPPAMIENCAKMAGMPVGPLSLSDEVALDLGLKVIKATEADLGPNSINPDQKKLMVELVEKQGRLGRKNSKGFYDYPEKGKGQKSLWPGLSALQPKQLDPDTLDIEELKQRFLVVQAVEAARTVEDHVITDSGRPMSARSSASALRRSPAARCPISTSWARGSSSSSATSWKPNTARASPRRNCWKTWRRAARPSTAASRRRSRRRRLSFVIPGRCEASTRNSSGW